MTAEQSTPNSKLRTKDESTRRIRKYAAMLAAWPRRSPRLLLPPPPAKYTCCRLNNKTIINLRDGLPDEILLSIFEYVPNAKDIAAVRSVCKSWRRLVDKTATIWRSLVFDDLPRCPSSASKAESWYRKAADYGNARAQVCNSYFHVCVFVYFLQIFLMTCSIYFCFLVLVGFVVHIWIQRKWTERSIHCPISVLISKADKQPAITSM